MTKTLHPFVLRTIVGARCALVAPGDQVAEQAAVDYFNTTCWVDAFPGPYFGLFRRTRWTVISPSHAPFCRGKWTTWPAVLSPTLTLTEKAKELGRD